MTRRVQDANLRPAQRDLVAIRNRPVHLEGLVTVAKVHPEHPEGALVLILQTFVELPVGIMNEDPRARRFLKRTGTRNVVEVAVRVQQGLDGHAEIADHLQYPLRVIARVDDDGLLRFFVREDVTVAGEGANDHGFVKHGGSLRSRVCSPQSSGFRTRGSRLGTLPSRPNSRCGWTPSSNRTSDRTSSRTPRS